MSAAAGGRVVRGAVLSYRGDPARAGPQDAVRFHQHGAVVLGRDGRIAWCGPAPEVPERFRTLASDDYGSALVLPGFIDAHIHFPQYRMLAAPGKDLLDWLQRFTFPEECRYRSRAHACAVAEVFLDRLLQHGTTAAVVFSTVHRDATDALCAAAEARRMAIVTGKTMMDRNAPAALCDDPARGVRGQRGADRTLARPRTAALCDHRALRRHLQRGAASRRRRACRPPRRLPRAHAPVGERAGDRAGGA